MNAVLGIAGADAAERTRRFAFLLTIVAALYGGYLYAPSLSAQYMTISIDGHRGIYNSAWMGMMTAVLSCSLLSLFGFYLVRGSLQRDRELATDGIVAASAVRKLPFVLGKWLSNVLILSAISVVMLGACVIMQLLRGEDRHIDLFAYLVPLVVFGIPAMMIVAALAVLMDSIKLLRGIIGGIVYLFLWTAMLAVPLTRVHAPIGVTPFDPLGLTAAVHSMAIGAQHAFPHANINEFEIGGGEVPRGGIKRFVYEGMNWTAAIVFPRVAWAFIALLMAALGAVFFDRFQSEASSQRAWARWQPNVAALIPNLPGLRLYRAELALLLNGASIWWLIGAVASIVVAAVLPLEITLKFVLPVALIWPLERWSALGARERFWNVADIVASAPHPIVRPMLAQWAAGSTLGIVLCAGYITKLLLAGDFAAIAACVLAVCAIGIAALACGVLSGTSRLFEAAYLMVWYLGPINHVPQLDFASNTLFAPAIVALASFAVAAVAGVTAVVGRLRFYAR